VGSPVELNVGRPLLLLYINLGRGIGDTQNEHPTWDQT
jgi:hypothetical protein